MSTGIEPDTQAALVRYSQSLHKFTQELWLEARRKAELEAQADARGVRRKPKATHGQRQTQAGSSSDSQSSQQPRSPHARN